MRVAGRHYRDFLNGIDNLHETMRFSYPKMLSPSFYVTHEHENGCLLHYRSKRVGFTRYVIGQLQTCGQRFYNTEVLIDVQQEEITENGCHVIFKMTFDNSAFNQHNKKTRKMALDEKYKRLNLATFLKVSASTCMYTIIFAIFIPPHAVN
jgi:guanylate cyclase